MKLSSLAILTIMDYCLVKCQVFGLKMSFWKLSLV